MNMSNRTWPAQAFLILVLYFELSPTLVLVGVCWYYAIRFRLRPVAYSTKSSCSALALLSRK